MARTDLSRMLAGVVLLVVASAVRDCKRLVQKEILNAQIIPEQTPEVVRASTSASMKRTTWDPPQHLIAPLEMVWGNYTWEKTYNNWLFQQIYANQGELKFCVKWNSTQKISQTERAALNIELATRTNKWIEVLNDYESWDYSKVTVKIVGWAAKDKAVLTGLDPEAERFTFNGADCNAACHRYFHKSGEYPDCPGGVKGHHDMVLSLKDNIRRGGGSGQDSGQNLGAADILRELKRNDSDRMHVFLHELGHGFGLDDFYRPSNVNNNRKPDRASPMTGFIMKAGSAVFVTEFDAWMLRNMWTCSARPQLHGIPPPAHCTTAPNAPSIPRQ